MSRQLIENNPLKHLPIVFVLLLLSPRLCAVESDPALKAAMHDFLPGHIHTSSNRLFQSLVRTERAMISSLWVACFSGILTEDELVKKTSDLNSSKSTTTLHWPLDTVDAQVKILGTTKVVTGAQGKSLMLDGNSLIELNDSKTLNCVDGFTFSAWFNPYAPQGEQQVIAGKNRYSLNERQWTLTVERDGKLKAYVQQGGWATIASPESLEAGRWYHTALAIDSDKATLYLNGRQVGEAKLKVPVPITQAPITLGGIHDNGRRAQLFNGAIDDARFAMRAMSANEISAVYKPVIETHKIPKSVVADTLLWDENVKLPKAAELSVLEGVDFHVIKANEPEQDGYIWLHGVGLVWHQGKLFASFGHNKGEENTAGEQARGRVSDDGGKTWGETFTIGVGDSPEHAVSHGVFLSNGDDLWAFHGSFYGHALTDIKQSKVHTRAYRLNETTHVWEPQGTVIEGGFWALNQPVKMADGNWIMPGICVGNGHRAAVAISHGEDFLKWDLVVIPAIEGLNMWGESAILVDGPNVTNIARFGAKAQALIAVSHDFGRTWIASSPSNLPMATSKPAAGILSTGQRYLICTTTANSGGRRTPLTIAVSKPNESVFSQVFIIRPSVFPQGPGDIADNAALSYPYAIEHEGKLYVGYSNGGGRRGNHNSAELAVIPIERLK